MMVQWHLYKVIMVVHVCKFIKKINHMIRYADSSQGFFSKFLMGGTWNFRSPSVPDGDEVGWGGGTYEKNLTEAKTAHLMQN